MLCIKQVLIFAYIHNNITFYKIYETACCHRIALTTNTVYLPSFQVVTFRVFDSLWVVVKYTRLSMLQIEFWHPLSCDCVIPHIKPLVEIKLSVHDNIGLHSFIFFYSTLSPTGILKPR